MMQERIEQRHDQIEAGKKVKRKLKKEESVKITSRGRSNSNRELYQDTNAGAQMICSYNRGVLTENKIRLGGKTERGLGEGFDRPRQPQPIYNG